LLELLKEIILDFQSETLDTGVKRHLQYDITKTVYLEDVSYCHDFLSA